MLPNVLLFVLAAIALAGVIGVGMIATRGSRGSGRARNGHRPDRARFSQTPGAPDSPFSGNHTPFGSDPSSSGHHGGHHGGGHHHGGHDAGGGFGFGGGGGGGGHDAGGGHHHG